MAQGSEHVHASEFIVRLDKDPQVLVDGVVNVLPALAAAAGREATA